MTIKILLDPVLTASPSGCSTNIQFVTFVKYVLETLKRTDVFFYWRVPEWVTDEEMKFYPQSQNIKYVPMTQHQLDRVQEYIRFPRDMEKAVDFYGDLWDYDVLITIRTPLVPMMKIRQISPRHRNLGWTKEVWLLEEMPMMSFKGTVPIMNERANDIATLTGYLAADKVYIVSYHEIIGIMDAARAYLSPSMQKEIRDKIKSFVPMQFENFEFKKPEFFTEKKPFCMAFVGRMEKTQAQLEEVNDLMVKKWIKKNEKIRMLACTTSRTVKVFDEKLTQVGSFPRHEFWRLMREETHVVVSLGIEMGFSLSLLEPMFLGTPAVVLRRPYVLPLLGPDYPFYVNGASEASGMVEYMYRNYPSCYAKFMKWHKEFLQPLYKERFKTDLLYPILNAEINRAQKNMAEMTEKKLQGKKNNLIVGLIVEWAKDKNELVIEDAIRALKDTGKLDNLAKKFEPEFLRSASLPWLPTWNEYRIALKAFFGWEDASTNVGHLRRKK